MKVALAPAAIAGARDSRTLALAGGERHNTP